MNQMKNIRVEKITLNVGAGKDQSKLEKGIKLLKLITNLNPIKTVTMKRVPTWGLRPNLPIGCKVTIRNKNQVKELLNKLLYAKHSRLKESNFDNNGSISFGIHEYVEIQGMEYNHDIGLMGLEVSITLERPGFRIKRRTFKTSKIGKKHKISKQEAIDFMNKEFDIIIGDQE
jgi:large subunit ribosomal protein L5